MWPGWLMSLKDAMSIYERRLVLLRCLLSANREWESCLEYLPG